MLSWSGVMSWVDWSGVMGWSGVVSWVGPEWCHGLVWSGVMDWSRAWLGKLRPMGSM